MSRHQRYHGGIGPGVFGREQALAQAAAQRARCAANEANDAAEQARKASVAAGKTAEQARNASEQVSGQLTENKKPVFNQRLLATSLLVEAELGSVNSDESFAEEEAKRMDLILSVLAYVAESIQQNSKMYQEVIVI